jgi:hypothetical protein
MQELISVVEEITDFTSEYRNHCQKLDDENEMEWEE